MKATAIEAVFNATFANLDVTLRGGYDEPLYLPGPPAELRYTRDHAASALHEAAHWCIAGASRRRRVDFGYRYVPPPRTLETRRAFMRAECKVQALEAIFADASATRFEVSADDFETSEREREAFHRAVQQQQTVWLGRSLPARAARFVAVLHRARRDTSWIASPVAAAAAGLQRVPCGVDGGHGR